MRQSGIVIGVFLIALGLIVAIFGFTRVQDYQTFAGQLARAMSSSAQEDYQLAIGTTAFGVVLAVLGFGITIYSATVLKDHREEKKRPRIIEERVQEKLSRPAIREFKEQIYSKKILTKPQKERRINYKRYLWIVGVVILLVVIVAFFPTPHARIRTEFNSNRINTLDCSNILEDGDRMYWDLTNLPSGLKIDVSLDSSEDVIVYLRSTQGVISQKEQMIHHYSVTCVGPSLYIEVKNPTFLGWGPSAAVSGEIKIFNYQEEQISYDEWLPWWMS